MYREFHLSLYYIKKSTWTFQYLKNKYLEGKLILTRI